MNPRTTVDKKIVICDKCKGNGFVENSEISDYHRHEYRYWNELCPVCKGSGRMHHKVETITTVEPYLGDTANKLQADLLVKKISDK